MKPAEEKIEPGGETMVSVIAKDAQGRPINKGEIALLVVDESVLALT